MCGEAKQNVKPHMGIFFILISIPKAQSAVRAASRMSDIWLCEIYAFSLRLFENVMNIINPTRITANAIHPMRTGRVLDENVS